MVHDEIFNDGGELKQEGYRTDLKRNFSSIMIVQPWLEVVPSLSSEAFKFPLDQAWATCSDPRASSVLSRNLLRSLPASAIPQSSQFTRSDAIDIIADNYRD